MIRSAIVEPAAETPVFVDSTGRRSRRLAIAGFFVALFAALYVCILGASVVQASDQGLSTKATVSTSATASASASSSSD